MLFSEYTSTMNTTTATELNGKKLYKVLSGPAEGPLDQSCSGGALTWSLPTLKEDGITSEPGSWHSVPTSEDQPLQLCRHGLHLTWDPVQWWPTDGRMAAVYEAEADEVGDSTEKDAKVVTGKARLLRRVSNDELAKLNIFLDGQHTINSGRAIAAGTAKVKACNNSTVKACGNSTVIAYHNSTVKACGNSTVTAYGNSSVTANDNSSVTAYHNSSVTANDNSTVKACGNSTIIQWSTDCEVSVEGNAVVIDRISNNLITKGNFSHTKV